MQGYDVIRGLKVDRIEERDEAKIFPYFEKENDVITMR